MSNVTRIVDIGQVADSLKDLQQTLKAHIREAKEEKKRINQRLHKLEHKEQAE